MLRNTLNRGPRQIDIETSRVTVQKACQQREFVDFLLLTGTLQTLPGNPEGEKEILSLFVIKPFPQFSAVKY